MLTSAKQILVSELALAEEFSEEHTLGLIEDKITNSFKTFRMDNIGVSTEVNKFIPFDEETNSVVG